VAKVEPQTQQGEVLVIGAGPAGLAVAGCLAMRGVRAQLIERGGAVGTSWRSHYRRLRLHTVKEHSALPHFDFPGDYPRYVAREELIAYLERYAERFGLQPWFGEEAATITREDGSWLTRCRSGRMFFTRRVVLATGANQRAHRPTFPGEDAYGGRILHSRDYVDAQPFLNHRVLVVGMGNTGAEIALDLVQNGARATLSVRSPVNIVRRDVLGRPTQVTSIMLSRLPSGVADAIARTFRDWTVGDLSRHGIQTPAMSPLRQLREEGHTPVIDIGTVDLIRRGKIEVRPGIASCTADGVRFLDGREERFEAVILATGYEADVAGLFPNEQVPVDGKGLPTHVIGTGSLAGVYFVGYDIRQPGGLLRTIGQQAHEVAADVTGSAAQR